MNIIGEQFTAQEPGKANVKNSIYTSQILDINYTYSSHIEWYVSAVFKELQITDE